MSVLPGFRCIQTADTIDNEHDLSEMVQIPTLAREDCRYAISLTGISARIVPADRDCQPQLGYGGGKKVLLGIGAGEGIRTPGGLLGRQVLNA
jgi:hypothetical protein